MSDAGNVVYPEFPPLLTIQGQISIHFLDGTVLEGEFHAQDALNIFLNVSGEAVMIPRTQIRFVKGQSLTQIVQDAAHLSARGASVAPAAEQEEDEDGTVVLGASPDQLLPTDEADDGTIVLAPDSDQTSPGEASNEAKVEETDDDGTIILNLDELSEEKEEAEDEDGTFILPFPTIEEEDPDQTEVLSALEDDDSDTTIVMPLDAQEPDISATLVCTSGPHDGDEFTLTSGITTVGRSSDNVLVLNKDKEISRHHAIIVQESGQFVVQDQNSLNGTFVNDKQITGPHYLQNGDDILVGLSTLHFQLKA